MFKSRWGRKKLGIVIIFFLMEKYKQLSTKSSFMLDMTDLSTLKWFVFKILWFHGWNSNTFCFTRPCISTHSLPSRDTIKQRLGTLLLAIEIKITSCYLYNAHMSLPCQATCITPGWLYLGDSAALPFSSPPAPQYCPGGIFLVRQWGHSWWLSHPHHTCIQPWLSPYWLGHCFIQAKKLQGTHQKPLKCSQPSAEKHLTWLPWLENLCHRISCWFQLQ